MHESSISQKTDVSFGFARSAYAKRAQKTIEKNARAKSNDRTFASQIGWTLLLSLIAEIQSWRPVLRLAVYAALLFFANQSFSNFETRRMAQKTDAIFKDIGNPDIKVRYIGNTIILEGTVYERAELERANSIAQAHQAVWTIRNVFEKPQVLSLVALHELMPRMPASQTTEVR